LEQKEINAWIPNFGQFIPEREGFIYNKELNRYECQRGNHALLPFKNARTDSKGYTRHIYRSNESVCKNCPHKTECCGEKTKFKKIEQSEHYDIYMKNHEKRLKNERYTARMSRLRSAAVEPVLRTLLNFTGMKRVNARGIAAAEKHVLMASLCYNLKKNVKIQAPQCRSSSNKSAGEHRESCEKYFRYVFRLFRLVFSPNKPLFFRSQKFAAKTCPRLNRRI
jgi:hypothetical protein